VLFIPIEIHFSTIAFLEGHGNELVLASGTTGQTCPKEQYHVNLTSLPKILLLRTVNESGWISEKAQAGTARATKGLNDNGKP